MSKLRQYVHELRKAGIELGNEAQAARTDASRKSAVFALRRRYDSLVDQIKAELPMDPQMRSDPHLAQEFARRLSEMRARISIFQAKWPAIHLDSGEQAFLGESETLRNINIQQFYDWADELLKRQ